MPGATPKPTQQEIWRALSEVPDPEIPVVSLVEMGIIRSVKLDPGGKVVVTITPTFSGCPALHVMKVDIQTRLQDLGLDDVELNISLSPPWTTDWIADSAREKLQSFGLAPPPRHGGQFDITLLSVVPCPYCGSDNTEVRNHFGPTPCRALSFCKDCREPFEQFKPL